jgi:hypothetical protein
LRERVLDTAARDVVIEAIGRVRPVHLNETRAEVVVVRSERRTRSQCRRSYQEPKFPGAYPCTHRLKCYTIAPAIGQCS